jgi:hypothetical protein
MFKFFFTLGCSATLLLSPSLMSGTVKYNAKNINRSVADVNTDLMNTSAVVLYDSLKLEALGLNRKAFKYAWAGYRNLLEKGKLKNTGIISICDFTQSSSHKRLYIIDIDNMRVSMNTYVAHGRKSGGEFAKSFSNNPNSHKSSLGFYVTGNTYYGTHGLSLRINGIEKGINDRALARNIVVHGSEYTGENFLENNSFCGRSYGCPAVPSDEIDAVITTIKEGSCLFIYYPNLQYLKRSKILNG